MKRFSILCLLLSIVAVGRAEAARLEREVTPEHYKLIVVPRMDTGVFLGDAVITVRVSHPVREITLHAAELDVDRVYVRDVERKQRAQVEIDPETSTMRIRLRRELVPGAAEIRISYQGPLRSDLRGLYVSRSAKATYLFTQLQPVDARRFFPCFDEPALKATFDLTVIVRDGDVAISNTKVISNLPGPSHGTRRVRFETTPPMSSYMLALAVGPFDCLSARQGETPVRFCAQRGLAWKGRASLEGAIEILGFYEDWFDLPYPFGKLDVVAVPDMAPGGMENPGAIFLRESWAMIDRDAGVEARRWWATLLAHELSHLWVGDLVTMEWWSDVWLNEGLATWLAEKALRQWQPELAVDELRAFRRMRTFDEDSLGSRRAVAAAIDQDDELFELFDLVTNEKPAAMLAMVEQMVGEDAIRRAIRDYLITYSWGNVSTDEFIAFVETRLGGGAARVMNDYVSRPGFPVVSVTTACDGADARVTIVEGNGSDTPWSVPVCFRSLTGMAQQRCVVVSGEAAVTIPGGCGAPLLVNPGEGGYYRVSYSKADLEGIVRSTSGLSVTEKLNLLDNEWWLVAEGRHGVGDYLGLIERGFAGESNPAVVGMIVSRLGFIDRQWASSEQRREFRQWMRWYFSSQLGQVGFVPRDDESREVASLRRELLWGAGALGRDPAVLEVARRYVRDFLGDPSSVDRSIADTMIQIAARSGDEALYNAYLSRARRPRGGQDSYRFLMGLTSFTDPDLVRRTIDLTLTDVVRSQDATSIVAKLLGNPESAEAAWQVVRDRWPEIEKRLPVTFTRDRIVNGAGSFCSRERREEVASFFSGVGAPSKAIDATIARIDRCIANRPGQALALASWLADDRRLASGASPGH